MKPKKKLPEGSETLMEVNKYILVKCTLYEKPYYRIYQFYDTDEGRRYWPRGADSHDLEAVKKEFARITGKKII